MEADPMAALAASADNGEKGAEGGTKRAAETDLATLEQQASQLLDVTEAAPGPSVEKAAENEAKKKELVENPEEIELDDEDEEDMDGIAQKTVPAAVFAGVEGGGALERLKKAKKS